MLPVLILLLLRWTMRLGVSVLATLVTPEVVNKATVLVHLACLCCDVGCRFCFLCVCCDVYVDVCGVCFVSCVCGVC